MTWPYWNQSKGADHLFVMTNDKGGTFARGAVTGPNVEPEPEPYPSPISTPLPSLPLSHP